MRKKRDEQYVTIKTVAEHAGVSTATVSRVINGGVVKSERKRRVLDSIKELNYIPNNSARNLASVRTTKRIVLIIPSLTPIYIDLIKGFKEGLNIYKYEGVIEEFFDDENVYKELMEKYERTSEVRGIVKFAPKEEIYNKLLFSILDEDLKIEIPDNIKGKKVAIYPLADKYLESFLLSKVFEGSKKYDSKSNFDYIIVEKTEQALKLHNDGYKGQIRILEPTKEINKIFSNMKSINLNFYKFGLIISRYMIKKITEVEVDEITLKVEE